MRVLSVGLLYPPHHLGGYELVFEGVTNATIARGHEVRVLVSDHRLPGRSGADGEHVRRALRSHLDASALRAAHHLDLRQRLAIERHNSAVLSSQLLELSPDVVCWWAMSGVSLTLIEQVRRAGISSVLMVHDTWPVYALASEPWLRAARRLRLALLAPLIEPLLGVPVRLDLDRSGRFLFNSAYTRDAVRASGLRPRDEGVLTPGVSPRYEPAASASCWRGRLLYVGRLDPVKGVDLAILALARLPAETTLTIVGAGAPAYEAGLRREAEALGVAERVTFAGAAEAGELPAFYAQSDAVLFPVRWQEPWGLVPLEAMAVGRPVIATAMGGAASYLRDGRNAIVVPPGDPSALAAAVERVAHDRGLRERLRAGGFQAAAEHSAARYERAAVDELERAAGAPRRR